MKISGTRTGNIENPAADYIKRMKQMPAAAGKLAAERNETFSQAKKPAQKNISAYKQFQAWKKIGMPVQWANKQNPVYARFKAVVYWESGNKEAWFFSLEGEENGNEEKAHSDLMRRVVQKIPPDLYSTITVYMNEDPQPRTDTKNYNFECCCYSAGMALLGRDLKISFNDAGKINIANTKAINKILTDQRAQRYNPGELETIKVQHNSEIKHPALFTYLWSRKINIDLCKPFLREVHFTLHGKKLFAVGIQNVKRGWELRNEFGNFQLKLSSSPKTYTCFPGDARTVCVFEGMMDFYSMISLYKKVPKSDIIILNSCVNVSHVRWAQYEKVFFFGDNDAAGSECLVQIPGAIDKRTIFAGHKDFNDYILNKPL